MIIFRLVRNIGIIFFKALLVMSIGLVAILFMVWDMSYFDFSLHNCLSIFRAVLILSIIVGTLDTFKKK